MAIATLQLAGIVAVLELRGGLRELAVNSLVWSVSGRSRVGLARAARSSGNGSAARDGRPARPAAPGLRLEGPGHQRRGLRPAIRGSPDRRVTARGGRGFAVRGGRPCRQCYETSFRSRRAGGSSARLTPVRPWRQRRSAAARRLRHEASDGRVPLSGRAAGRGRSVAPESLARAVPPGLRPGPRHAVGRRRVSLLLRDALGDRPRHRVSRTGNPVHPAARSRARSRRRGRDLPSGSDGFTGLLPES